MTTPWARTELTASGNGCAFRVRRFVHGKQDVNNQGEEVDGEDPCPSASYVRESARDDPEHEDYQSEKWKGEFE